MFYVGTFSKILAPALRLGWLRLPASLAESFAAVKEIGDLECSRLSVLAVARLLRDLDLERHLELLRGTYRRRRNAMLEALAAHLPAGCRFTEPGGGMFVWVELPEGVERRAAAPADPDRTTGRLPSRDGVRRRGGSHRNQERGPPELLAPGAEAVRQAVADFAACI